MPNVPKLAIHSKSSPAEKAAYRELYKEKVPLTPTEKSKRLKWIWDECRIQDRENSYKGCHMDFVMEEFWRCHPDVSEDQEARRVKEQQIEKIMKKWALRGKVPIKGTRIIVAE